MSAQPLINPWRAFVGAWVPNWLMERTEVSPGAKLTYGRLAQFSGKDGVCKPGQEELAEALGVSARQARRYLDELQDAARLDGFALIQERRMGRGRSNHYAFLQHPWMTGVLPAQKPAKRPARNDRTHPSTQTDDRTHPSTQTAVEWTHLSGPERTHLSGLYIGNEENQGREVVPYGAPPAPAPAGQQTSITEQSPAQRLLGEHISQHPQRPPSRVVGQTAREIRQLIEEGVSETAIRDGLALVRAKGLHPSTLPSCTNQAMNPPEQIRQAQQQDDMAAARARLEARYAN